MRDFKQWALQEGFFTGAIMNFVKSKLGPLKRLVDQAIAKGQAAGKGELEVIQDILSQIQTTQPDTVKALVGAAQGSGSTPAEVAEHVGKMDLILTPVLETVNERGFEEGIEDIAGNPDMAARLGEAGAMINKMFSLGVTAAGVALAVYIAYAYHQPIINVLSLIGRAGASLASRAVGAIKPGESDALKQYKADKAARSDAQQQQARNLALRAQAQRARQQSQNPGQRLK